MSLVCVLDASIHSSHNFRAANVTLVGSVRNLIDFDSVSPAL